MAQRSGVEQSILPKECPAQPGEKGRAGGKVDFIDGSGFSPQTAFGGKLGFFPAGVHQILHRQAKLVAGACIIDLQIRHEIRLGGN